MIDSEIQLALSNKSALALTMWAEGRGEPVEGQIAIGCVCHNRLLKWARFGATEATYRAVCLAPKQFSCWQSDGGSKNYAALMAMAEKIVQGLAWKDAELTQCLYLAEGIISGALLDNTNGATNYFAPKAMVPEGTIPKWAINKPALVIGAQRFLAV